MAQHGFAPRKKHARIYNIWTNMKSRCDNPNNPAYRWYGGKGITYSPQWKTFEGFYEDMKDGYSDSLTLDRLNGNRGYSKENCRWISNSDQQNNRADTRRFTIGDITKTFLEWRRDSELKSSTIRQRFYGLGWTIEESLFTPLIRKRG